MSISLSLFLKPEAEQAVRAYAVGNGISLDRAVEDLVERGIAAPVAPTMSGMTPRQAELLEFIKAYSKANGGVCPSFEEMMAHAGLRSKSGIHRIVCALIERGFVQHSYGRKRDLVLNPMVWG